MYSVVIWRFNASSLSTHEYLPDKGCSEKSELRKGVVDCDMIEARVSLKWLKYINDPVLVGHKGKNF